MFIYIVLFFISNYLKINIFLFICELFKYYPTLFKKIILILLTGTESVIGAKSGSVYEYYFRTSLDKYSALLGMIFAMNFPLVS